MEVCLAKYSDTAQLAEMRWDFQLEEPTEKASVSKEEFISEFKKFAKSIFSSERWQVWVAKENSEIVAHMFLQRVDLVPKPQDLSDKQYGYLTNCYVRPEDRNKGVGSELLQEVVNSAKQEGLETLIVWPSEKSVNFYERAGFSAKNDILELALKP